MTFGTANIGLRPIVPIEPGSCVAAFDPVRAQPKRSTKHDGAGYGTLHTVVRFVAWSHEQRHFPTPEQVMARFSVAAWCELPPYGPDSTELAA